jgi:hypothetical protein
VGSLQVELGLAGVVVSLASAAEAFDSRVFALIVKPPRDFEVVISHFRVTGRT